MLTLLIQYSKEQRKELYVGFTDFEKAFDFSNRANILSDLMKKGCGSKLTNAIFKMFKKTTYHPKKSNNRLAEGIKTDYGVTQGRRSSGNLFSFQVSDMPASIKDLKGTSHLQTNILEIRHIRKVIASGK